MSKSMLPANVALKRIVLEALRDCFPLTLSTTEVVERVEGEQEAWRETWGWCREDRRATSCQVARGALSARHVPEKGVDEDGHLYGKDYWLRRPTYADVYPMLRRLCDEGSVEREDRRGRVFWGVGTSAEELAKREEEAMEIMRNALGRIGA